MRGERPRERRRDRRGRRRRRRRDRELLCRLGRGGAVGEGGAKRGRERESLCLSTSSSVPFRMCCCVDILVFSERERMFDWFKEKESLTVSCRKC